MGLGFSHDISAAKSERLQPLKFRFCISLSTLSGPNLYLCTACKPTCKLLGSKVCLGDYQESSAWRARRQASGPGRQCSSGVPVAFCRERLGFFAASQIELENPDKRGGRKSDGRKEDVDTFEKGPRQSQRRLLACPACPAARRGDAEGLRSYSRPIADLRSTRQWVRVEFDRTYRKQKTAPMSTRQ